MVWARLSTLSCEIGVLIRYLRGGTADHNYSIGNIANKTALSFHLGEIHH